MVLFALIRAKASRTFSFLTALLSVRLSGDIACLVLFAFCGKGIEKHLAYDTYFYVYWSSYAIEAVLNLLIVVSIFRLAMAPLKGLQTLGMLVFKWAGAISIAIALGITISPHQSGSAFMVAMITQLEQTSSILTLCLLLFVCFAIRPMGLSYGSRIFGVSLGMGVMSAVSLISAAWISHTPQMYSTVNMILRSDGLRMPAALVGLLRLPGTEAPHHHAAHHLTIPPVESDLRGSRRRTRLCSDSRHPARGLCPSGARGHAACFG